MLSITLPTGRCLAKKTKTGLVQSLPPCVITKQPAIPRTYLKHSSTIEETATAIMQSLLITSLLTDLPFQDHLSCITLPATRPEELQ